MAPVKLLVVGCGSRGTTYSNYAKTHPELAQVVAIAEPRQSWRDKMLADHDIPSENIFTDWREASQHEKLADAVIIATQDAMHVEPAVAFANKGYHMLLEKPMAPDAEGCRTIVQAAIDNNITFAVCHVLRYTDYTQKLKELVDSQLIGDIVTVQHLEPVGYWHQAHSYVRGNWRNEAESSSMLLAKSCHDLDWIRYIVGKHCKKVSSFGSLYHFRKEHKPEGAASRCLDCSVEATCPYSARKIYLGRVAAGHTFWPVDVLTPDTTIEGVTEALRTGPYGRCVYECDNDVVDHQIVNMEFEQGVTATFTMTAFTEAGHRQTTLFGTQGMLVGDGERIKHTDFLTDKTVEVEIPTSDATIMGGHGGGDYRIMQSFIKAITSNDTSQILSGPEETLETHLMVFSAEKARKDDTIESI